MTDEIDTHFSLRKSLGFPEQGEEQMERTKISLPVDANGDPDWVYMETFMSDIIAQERRRLEAIKPVNIADR